MKRSLFTIKLIAIITMIFESCNDNFENNPQSEKFGTGKRNKIQDVNLGGVHNEAVAHYILYNNNFSPKLFVSNDTTYLTILGSNNIKNSINDFLISKGLNENERIAAIAEIDSFLINTGLIRKVWGGTFIIDSRICKEEFLENLYNYALNKNIIHEQTLDLIWPSINAAIDEEDVDSVKIMVDNITVPGGSPQIVYDQVNDFKLVVDSSYSYWIDQLGSTITAEKINYSHIQAKLKKSSYVIIGDAAGALIGSICGFFGSVAASAYASVYINETFPESK